VDGGLTLALVAAFGAYDPLIDGDLAPPTGMSVGLGVQRLQDDFGVTGSISSPWLFGGHLAVRVDGGVGWFSDLRALPSEEEGADFGALSEYAYVRALLLVSTRVGLASGRLYAGAGPSVLFIDEQLSSSTTSPGIYGVAGVELFAGDAFQAFPASFFIEAGAVAHTAEADVESRGGRPTASEGFIERSIATGFALSAGLRYTFW